MANVLGWFDSSLPAPGAGSWQNIRISRRGEARIIGFYEQMAIDGRCFQAKLGTIATPITGDVPIADSSAELSVDAASGLTVIPVGVEVTFVTIPGNPTQVIFKYVAAPSTNGTATFVPLNLLVGGAPASSTVRTGTAGSVSVPAELATTTRRAYSATWAGVGSASGFDVASGSFTNLWAPRIPPIVQGSASGSCAYLQVGSTGTAPTYYAHFDYVELATAAL